MIALARVWRAAEPTLTPARGSKGGSAGDPPYPPPQVPPVPNVPTPPPNGPQRRRPPGVTAGIVLIVIGGVFLVGQVVPGLAWWTLWPLIIIIAGVVQAFTPGEDGWSVDRMFDGFVTVAVGLVILAITTGVVGFSVVWQILALWPVLLIAIGLDLLGKALHTSWVRALGSVAVIAALAYSVAVTAGGVQGFSFTGTTAVSTTRTVEEPVGSVTDAQLNLKAGAAAITLEGGKDLVRAEASGPWGTPQLDVSRSGSSCRGGPLARRGQRRGGVAAGLELATRHSGRHVGALGHADRDRRVVAQGGPERRSGPLDRTQARRR